MFSSDIRCEILIHPLSVGVFSSSFVQFYVELMSIFLTYFSKLHSEIVINMLPKRQFFIYFGKYWKIITTSGFRECIKLVSPIRRNKSSLVYLQDVC